MVIVIEMERFSYLYMTDIIYAIWCCIIDILLLAVEKFN